MPVNKVASTLYIIANRVWRGVNYWVGDGVKKDSLEGVRQIGIDETPAKKGHEYITICADLEKRRVIYVCEGRENKVVSELTTAITKKKGDVRAVSHVVIDMSPAYI